MRIQRYSIFLAALVAAAALTAATALASPAPTWPDTLSGPDWSLAPGSPCVRDSVTLTVMGFHDTPCDSFIGVERIEQHHVRVRSLVRDGYACLVAPIPYPIRVPLGLFAAGAQTIDIEYEIVHLAQGGAATYLEYRHTMVGFQVSADCPVRPGPLPYVRSIVTDPVWPCAQKPTTLVLEGVFNDGCGRVIDQSAPGAPLELTIKVATGPDTVCTLSLVPWRVEFPLGFLAAGNYQVGITLHVIEQDPTGPGLVRRTYTGTHQFFVSPTCDPSVGPLPYVNSIFVGRRGPCDDGPPCPLDSVLVRVGGQFPSDCFTFRRIELVPSPIVGPAPEPPIVRIIVDDGGCLGRPCRDVTTYWSGAVMLPPLPARDYSLMVELAQVSCSDTYPPGQLYQTRVPFTVTDTCTTPSVCLMAGFAHGTSTGPACNASISPGVPAELTFQVGSSVALAGLQGEFKLHPSVLRITKLEAIGPAAGMILNWTPTAEGVRFVLFAQSGAPIPPLPPHDTMGPDPGGWPVLRITVEEPATGEAPEVTLVTAENLLGSDIDGHGIPLCPASPCGPHDPLYPPIGMPRATICSKHACDFNADGLEDVRDLVTMVHCVMGEGACPPDGGLEFDCDGDNVLGIGDVLCCARHILGRPPCADCPYDSSGVRPEPGVAVSFGTPIETSSGVDLPMHITRTDRLGGAMLTLEAPLDRYDVVGFDGGAVTQWLTLHEMRDGHLMLGMIDVQGPNRPTALGHLDLTLHLTLKNGQMPGGEVAAVAGEFRGPDGAMLAVTLGRPSQTLPGAARVELSSNHPNPFSAETRFTLQLAAASDVEVGIYDLRGRRMATVFRGHLSSGPQEFHWDGRGDDGSPATNGVYFYRVVAGGRTVARKLILMRGN